jgi:SAM-dependent methyltransferase
MLLELRRPRRRRPRTHHAIHEDTEVAVDSNSLRSTQSYWNAAAETYAKKFSGTTVGHARRQAVWHDLERAFKPGQHILELNCGTGIDAVFLARKGIRVLACDIAPRMIELARALAAESQSATPPDFRILATENLATLRNEGPFDGAFSNFSGLNCVDNLSEVAIDLEALLKPRARLLLCMMGRFVPWEIVWFLARGRPHRALMSLINEHTHYGGNSDLRVQRPTVATITRQMAPAFRLVGWKGIGVTVPPSYTERWARHFPKLIDRLAAIDHRIGHLPLLRNMADCVLLEFERRETPALVS